MSGTFLWILSNSVTLICFTVMAIMTKKWWIVLLALLFKSDLTITKTVRDLNDPIYEDDGRNEEDTPREIAEHRNCTVTETYDPVTGEIMIRWWKQDNTETEYADGMSEEEYNRLVHGS